MGFNWFSYIFDIVIADIYFIFYLLMVIPVFIGIVKSIDNKSALPTIIGAIISALISFAVISYADTAQEKRIEAKREGFEHVHQKSLEQAQKEKELAQKEAEKQRKEQEEFNEWKKQQNNENSESDLTDTSSKDTSSTESDPIEAIILVLMLAGFAVPVFFTISGAAIDAMRDRRKTRKQEKYRLQEIQTTFERFEQEFHDLDQKYVNAETSPETFIKRPLILDVTYPTTAEFHRSRKAAHIQLQATRNCIELGLETPDMVELNQKIENAHQTWDILWNEANKVGIPLIEGRKARLLQKHLNVILDESATQAERSLNAKSLISLLDDIEHDLNEANQKEYVPMIETLKKRVTKAETLGILPTGTQLNDAIEA